jgi:putative polyhydroxyalkanoate system protein
MSDIKLVKTHSLPIAKAKILVQEAAEELAAEYDLESEWHGNTLRFHRSGVEGHVSVTPSELQFDVKLGLLLKPLKSKLVGQLERKFEKLTREPGGKETTPSKNPRISAKKKVRRS